MAVPFRMRYNVKWREYAGAPKATNKSRWLGRLMCMPMLGLYGFIWVLALFAFIQSAFPRNVQSLLTFLSLVTLIPFYFGLANLRELIEHGIAESAQKERAQALGQQ